MIFGIYVHVTHEVEKYFFFVNKLYSNFVEIQFMNHIHYTEMCNVMMIQEGILYIADMCTSKIYTFRQSSHIYILYVKRDWLF